MAILDRINVYAKDSEKVVDVLNRNKDEIKSEVLADDIITGSTDGYEKSWNINGEDVVMAVKKN